MRTIIEIDRARKIARISKRELCRASGVHVETYRRWMRDKVSPTVRNLSAVDQALKTLVRETIEAAQ